MFLNRFILSISIVIFAFPVISQIRINEIGGQTNPITVSVPFVSFAPDSRSSAMGDIGVATRADAYSAHWNSAKLVFIEKDMGFSFSYSPWLGNIVDDMSLNYLTFYKKIDPINAFGASLRYFDMGEIQLTDLTGNNIGLENPREAAFDVTYSRKLGENLSAGLSLRYIWSNLTGNITGAPSARAGSSLAFDVGIFYNKPIIFMGKESNFAAGASLSNIGQKISYTNDQFEDFIPGNMRLGTAYTLNLDAYNSLTLGVDLNKLLVPTPPEYLRDEDGNLVVDPITEEFVIARGKDPNRPFISGTFGSFTDAPGGFREEWQEISLGTGLEYWYRNIFAFRAGYFFEHKNKGDRKYFTTGMGFRYQVFGLDFSYLIPQQQNHPLAETLRISLLINMEPKNPVTVKP